MEVLGIYMCKARGELLGSDPCTVKLTSQDGSKGQSGETDVGFRILAHSKAESSWNRYMDGSLSNVGADVIVHITSSLEVSLATHIIRES